MSIKKLALRSGGLLIPLLGALYTAACGGSAFSDGPGSGASGGAAGSAVGGSGTGGTGMICTGSCLQVTCGPGEISVTEPGACCRTCVPNGQGGTGGASGGSTGVGGCSGVACTAGVCGVGFTSVTKPGDCCPTCVPDGQGGTSGTSGSSGSGGCGVVSCPAYDCAVGYKLEQQPDQCCPTCVPDPNACPKGQQGYDTLRASLLQPPSVLKCKVDADCTTVPGSAYCGDPCAASPVNVTSAPSINSQLSSYATDNCSACTPTYPPCAAPLPPHCVNSVCSDGAVTGG